MDGFNLFCTMITENVVNFIQSFGLILTLGVITHIKLLAGVGIEQEQLSFWHQQSINGSNGR
jgi:hypothetical protein